MWSNQRLGAPLNPDLPDGKAAFKKAICKLGMRALLQEKMEKTRLSPDSVASGAASNYSTDQAILGKTVSREEG